jgi:phosphoserine phosphatase
VLTAGTHGGIERAQHEIGQACRASGAQAPAWRRDILRGEDKASYVRALGDEQVVAVGNGANDVAMFAVAALAIVVLGREGASADTLAAARVVVTSPLDALDLLRFPLRLSATLRR